MSVEEKVQEYYLFQCFNHNVHENYGLSIEKYCNRQINKMTNVEFLKAISKAVHEEIIEQLMRHRDD